MHERLIINIFFFLGPLLKEIVNQMQESQINKDSKKAYFYSVHDVTLVNLLRTMGFTNELFLPEYGATIIFELHSYSDKEREVKVTFLSSAILYIYLYIK